MYGSEVLQKVPKCLLQQPFKQYICHSKQTLIIRFFPFIFWRRFEKPGQYIINSLVLALGQQIGCCLVDEIKDGLIEHVHIALLLCLGLIFAAALS